jgi:hypothetical protein
MGKRQEAEAFLAKNPGLPELRRRYLEQASDWDRASRQIPMMGMEHSEAHPAQGQQ